MVHPWMNEWIKKLWYIDTMKYYSAIKTKCFPFVKTWIDVANIMVSKIRWTEKDKCYIISLLCGILKTNKQNPNSDTDNRLVIDRWGGRWKKWVNSLLV